jgi:hypothetical protein
VLSKILKDKSNQVKSSMQVRDMHEKYHRAQETYRRVTKSKDIHKNSPKTLRKYLDKKRVRDIILLKVGMETIMDFKRTYE